jgi:hypothetical protein
MGAPAQASKGAKAKSEKLMSKAEREAARQQAQMAKAAAKREPGGKRPREGGAAPSKKSAIPFPVPPPSSVLPWQHSSAMQQCKTVEPRRPLLVVCSRCHTAAFCSSGAGL